MPPISYCSLDEAWGIQKKPNKEENNINRFDKLSEDSQKERNTVIDNMNYIERNSKNNNSDSKELLYDKSHYPKLDSIRSVSRQVLIDPAENEKYKMNPMNKVAPLKSSSNILNDTNNSNKKDLNYDDKEKNYYKERLTFLENELQKCKNYLEIYKNKENNMENTIESFQNSNNNSYNSFATSNTSNDIIDLIFLIIIGLVIIFIMNSIFKLGKSIGAR